MNMQKIDKHIAAINRKYRYEKIRKIMAVIGLCIGTGVAGYLIGHRPIVKAGLKAPMAVKTPNTAEEKILPDGYSISRQFDATYWGKDGNFPNNQHPDYVQALRGGKMRSISGPHGSYFTYGTYEDGTYSMHIGVESQFEDTQMELYRMPDGQWRFNCISDDFKDW